RLELRSDDKRFCRIRVNSYHGLGYPWRGLSYPEESTISRMRFGHHSFSKNPGRKKALVFDFHATTPFDFFSAMYVLIARRLFCLLRLCQFFRASCFMLILLVRRDKPAGYLRMGVPHGEGLTTHADLSHAWLSASSKVATGSDN